MPVTKPTATNPADELPDQIWGAPKTARFWGVSERTLARMNLPKIQISPGRIGYSGNEQLALAKQRTIRPKNAA